jgi:AmmeMemoRadiSam system protein A
VNFSDTDRMFMVNVACLTIRHRIAGAKTAPMVTGLPAAATQLAGCFVSLHAREGNGLRGCVGRIDSSLPLLEALQGAAWQVPADQRFAANPVTKAELPLLTIELSILGMLRRAPSLLTFSPKDDGLYLIVNGRPGVFLPQVARETGWNQEQLLDRLCAEKLGLPPRTWQTGDAHLFTFPSEVIGPVDFVYDPASQK